MIEKLARHFPTLLARHSPAGDAIVVFHCLVWALSAKLELAGEACVAIDRLETTRRLTSRATERERLEAERHEAEYAARMATTCSRCED